MSGKIFVAGGGTGGHFYPAISVSEKFYQNGYKPVLIGAERGIEAQKDFPFGEKKLFKMEYVRGKSLLNKIKAIYVLSKSIFHILKEIKKEKPQFCICFGGYTSLPLGFASFLSKTPLYIHEQNSYPSYTNIILSKFAKKVFITFPFTKKLENKKTIHTGMPLRKSVLEKLNLPKEKAKKNLNILDKPHILIIGGSQGAKKLNEIGIELAKNNPDYFFTIIYGKRDIPEINLKNLRLIPFYDDMGTLYASSDFVISRAGSGTVNELIAFGKYTLYVPYPYAASNHQYYNALWLKEKNLSEIIEDRDLNKENAQKVISAYLKKSEEEKKDIENQLKTLAKLNSSDIIFKSIIQDFK